MAIEGILEAEALRDFLYHRMRGARGLDAKEVTAADAPAEVGVAIAVESALCSQSDEATALLRDIRDALIALARRREGQS
jgi:hypothetical protein